MSLTAGAGTRTLLLSSLPSLQAQVIQEPKNIERFSYLMLHNPSFLMLVPAVTSNPRIIDAAVVQVSKLV